MLSSKGVALPPFGLACKILCRADTLFIGGWETEGEREKPQAKCIPTPKKSVQQQKDVESSEWLFILKMEDYQPTYARIGKERKLQM